MKKKLDKPVHCRCITHLALRVNLAVIQSLLDEGAKKEKKRLFYQINTFYPKQNCKKQHLKEIHHHDDV